MQDNIDWHSKLNSIKQQCEDRYKSIDSVHCPYLKRKVAFNVKGLEHIKFKSKGRPRHPKEQYIRLKLLELAPRVLMNSYTIQEFSEKSIFERQKTNSRWEHKLVSVTYYGFVAIINSARIKIIVKEIQGGEMFFWSIIPFWKNDKHNDQNKKVLHTGDLEND